MSVKLETAKHERRALLRRMNVSVTRNFQPEDRVHRDETGTVTRVEKLNDGRWGVAIRILQINARHALGRSR